MTERHDASTGEPETEAIAALAPVRAEDNEQQQGERPAPGAGRAEHQRSTQLGAGREPRRGASWRSARG